MAEQILYSFCESLVRRQAEAERVMLEEFRKGTYTIEKPFVKINPYLINPLAAVVMFMTEEETAVTVTVYGKEARGNIVHTFPPAKEHILPVLGLYADFENKVELRAYEKDAHEIRIQTEKLSGDEPRLIHMKTGVHFRRSYFCNAVIKCACDRF